MFSDSLIDELKQDIGNTKADLIRVTRSDYGKLILIVTHSNTFKNFFERM